MKKLIAICAAVLASGLFAGDAKAQGPGMMPPAYGPELVPSPYGWHPKIQMIAIKHGSDRCGRPSLFSRLFGPKHSPAGPQNGTLVFPNNPFVRSPRDFFMLDQ